MKRILFGFLLIFATGITTMVALCNVGKFGTKDAEVFIFGTSIIVTCIAATAAILMMSYAAGQPRGALKSSDALEKIFYIKKVFPEENFVIACLCKVIHEDLIGPNRAGTKQLTTRFFVEHTEFYLEAVPASIDWLSGHLKDGVYVYRVEGHIKPVGPEHSVEVIMNRRRASRTNNVTVVTPEQSAKTPQSA